MIQAGSWPAVAVPAVKSQIDLAPPSTELDPDAAASGAHCWVLIEPEKLPPRATAETLSIVWRMGFDFLGWFGLRRNRPRYAGETAEHYRIRLRDGVGRALSGPAIVLELEGLLGYAPRLEERREEWSGWLIPGLSCAGYGGGTIDARYTGPERGFQPRFRGAHGRAASDAARKVWLHIKAADTLKEELAEVIERSRAAGVEFIVIGDL